MAQGDLGPALLSGSQAAAIMQLPGTAVWSGGKEPSPQLKDSVRCRQLGSLLALRTVAQLLTSVREMLGN